MKIRILMFIMCLSACFTVADAQKRKTKKAPANKTEQIVEVINTVEAVDTVAIDTISQAIQEPKDYTDTLYYDKNWRVISNKTFASYYRYALYPADERAPRYFKTFYISGELQGEGMFIELDKRNDANSIFEGEVDLYHKNGNLSEKILYKGEQPNGEYTNYYENGNIKEHVVLKNGKKDGILAHFSEEGTVCRLQEYEYDKAADYYVVVDKDGNYSKYDVATEQPILETPKQDEIQTEYKNGVAWPYYNKNGLIVGVSNSTVKENIGDFREIGVFIVNKSMINVDIDPANIEVYYMKNGKRSDFEMMAADEYDKKVYKKKVKNTKKQLKKKAVVTIERENNVSDNLGASVFDAGNSNTLKAFQENICKLKTLVKGNKMKYAERKHEDLGYLERTTVHPGEVVSGFMLTSKKKVEDLFVKLTISGIEYIYEWKTEK